MNNINKYNLGFTLLEMIIYIALFSIMIGGLIMTSFMLVQNSHKTESRITVQAEMNFVLKKIDWVINQAKDIDTPTSNVLEVLSVNKKNPDGTFHMFYVKFENNKITLDGQDITSGNVIVDNLTFETINGTPKGLRIHLDIRGNAQMVSSGQEVSYIRYLRNI